MDPRIVGAFISNKRKNRNLTQLELAQMLNVSHQAISKWERGESLPDISILPQLSRVFEVTIDALLTGEADKANGVDAVQAADAVKVDSVAAVDPEDAAAEEDTVDEVVAADEVDAEDSAVDEADAEDRSSRTVEAESPSTGMDKPAASIEHLISLAPFVSQETLEAMVTRVDGSINLRNLSSLAPFLNKTTLSTLAARRASEGAEDSLPHHLVSLAPFLEPTALTALVRDCAIHAFDSSILTSLAPFLEQSELIRLVEQLETDVPPGQLAALAPFLPKTTLDRLALRYMG